MQFLYWWFFPICFCPVYIVKFDKFENLYRSGWPLWSLQRRDLSWLVVLPRTVSSDKEFHIHWQQKQQGNVVWNVGLCIHVAAAFRQWMWFTIELKSNCEFVKHFHMDSCKFGIVHCAVVKYHNWHFSFPCFDNQFFWRLFIKFFIWKRKANQQYEVSIKWTIFNNK